MLQYYLELEKPAVSPDSFQVDHFGYANNDTFKMRYLVADQYWDHDGGPIFFYTGNEADIEVFANKSYSGLMWEWAPEFKALLIFAEHRYYGKSMPYGNESFKGPSRHGYLTAEQALADYADLLTHFKADVPGAGDSKVVSFGGSYGGMLAAWFRLKYPHVTTAALASSAPILQFTGMTPCNAFSEVVTKAFAKESNQCTNAIRTSFELIRKQAATEEGAKALKKQFRLCKPLAPSNDTVLRDWIRNVFAYLAMVNYPYASKLTLPAPGHPVKEACKFLKKNFTDVQSLLDGIYRAISVLTNYTGKIHCNDLSDNAGTPGIHAHHLDLRSSNPADPESVVVARKVEKMYIKKWLREAQASA
ncbi:prolylcarboxypeptidase, putative [Ixodes scapularis]|uniref:Lysosomal Pro-X carboxypeptidase n=1 Tax=Ixodes scapularis TaxID=6945 RepID=B7PBW0_IXOSC|nr:prolylcarboxypeptidase, putative [Ixodes scapularis]|eukprot:XP_002408972.1 prolylcarboxypeptidase, putative [Ixodes scapularis]